MHVQASIVQYLKWSTKIIIAITFIPKHNFWRALSCVGFSWTWYLVLASELIYVLRHLREGGLEDGVVSVLDVLRIPQLRFRFFVVFGWIKQHDLLVAGLHSILWAIILNRSDERSWWQYILCVCVMSCKAFACCFIQIIFYCWKRTDAQTMQVALGLINHPYWQDWRRFTVYRKHGWPFTFL